MCEVCRLAIVAEHHTLGADELIAAGVSAVLCQATMDLETFMVTNRMVEAEASTMLLAFCSHHAQMIKDMIEGLREGMAERVRLAEEAKSQMD